MNNMDKKLLKIVNYYGLPTQLKYMQSEIFEFNEAVIIGRRREVKEELADVMVMLRQIQLKCEITDEEIKEVMEYKVDRQIKRIDKEKEE